MTGIQCSEVALLLSNEVNKLQHRQHMFIIELIPHDTMERQTQHTF